MRSNERRMLNAGQVTAGLACSRGTVYRLIASGNLPAVRLGAAGASLRVNARELEGWLRSRDTGRGPNPHPRTEE